MKEKGTSRFDLLRRSWHIIIAPPFYLALFLPLLVFALNPDSPTIDIDSICHIGVLPVFAISVCLGLLVLIPKVGRLVIAACEAASLCSILLIAFPNRTGELTGFSPFLASSPVLAWVKICFTLAISILLFRLVPGALRTINQAMFVMVVIGCLIIVLHAAPPSGGQMESSTTERTDIFELGKDANVLIIVLDGFTGYRMVEILAENPKYELDFAGFTLYPRTVACALNTVAGISTILTGDLRVALSTADPLTSIRSSLAQSILNDARKQGYAATFVSNLEPSTQIVQTRNEQRLIPPADKSWRDRLGEYVYFWHLAATRILPPSRYLAHRILSLYRGQRAQISKQAMNLLINQLHTGRRKSCALLWHSKLSHPPYYYSKDGDLLASPDPFGTSHFSVKTLIRLLNKLKAISCYDNALIIVVSDHGQSPVRDPQMGGIFRGPEKLPTEFNALLMVKPVNSFRKFRQSTMSTWLGDVAATVRDQLGMSGIPNAHYASRSLLQEDDPKRLLNIPLFLRQKGIGYHSSLDQWKRKNIKGVFSDYAHFRDN